MQFKRVHLEVDERRRRQYLRAMGITNWAGSQASSSVAVVDVERRSRARGVDAGDPSDLQSLRSIEEIVKSCRACNLCETRRNTVFGSGSATADWLLVGEAPGAEEDKQGLPFVGRAGQLLNNMLSSLGLDRGDAYIANVLKCRPPRNRDPMGEEVRKCEPYLHQQIGNIQPRIIIAMGRFAAQSLLKDTTPISRLRGQVHEYEKFGIPLIATYHPAYLLRSPLEKRKAWTDLVLARATLEKPGEGA